MTKIYFIAGTDTAVGKTYVTSQLLNKFNQQGYSTLGLKPLSSGGYEDAKILQEAASIKLPIEEITPVCFDPPIAPHIAAEREGVQLNANQIANHCLKTIEKYQETADYILIEGVGGWLMPLDDQNHTVADVVKQLNIPVILVVGMRLGCLNHALLTQEAILNSGVQMHGWVANCMNPDMFSLKENIETLEKLIPTQKIKVLAFPKL